jgi:hypothetical protein
MISDISFRLISSDFYFRKLTTDAFGSSSCTNTKRSSLYSGSKESEEGGRAERNHLAISTLSGKSFYEYECKGFERTIHLKEPSLVEKNMHIQCCARVRLTVLMTFLRSTHVMHAPDYGAGAGLL